ncbi:MAG: aldehyde reductase [Desulfobacula sp.]|nr:aldehyde reductase [Desulfobacula sp.]
MNKKIDKTAPILVTGGTGYLASWIIKQLLDEGLNVRTTVRNKSNKEKNKHLMKLGNKGKGALEFYEADLLIDGSFDQAMSDCELVFHTASPFQVLGIKDPQKELIDPALKGTKNILGSVNKSQSVKRVVLTSSCVSVYGDAIETAGNPLNENTWNTTSSFKNNPYPFSKKIAEEKAWEIARSQNRWDLITINPGFILGPSLSNRIDSFSLNFMISLINGKNKSGVPALAFPIVDVRDVAKAHILGAFTPNASGRHIVTTGKSLFYLEIAQIIKNEYGEKYPVPVKSVPNFILYIVGPFMKMKWNFLRNNLGIRPELDNSYSKKDLGMDYRTIEETVMDHIQQIVQDGLI